MALHKQEKNDLIKKFRYHENDTASAPVQIALLTARLDYLNKHFQSNKKDHHSRRGLMRLVGQRRSLLDYLQRKDANLYKKLIDDLGIRK